MTTGVRQRSETHLAAASGLVMFAAILLMVAGFLDLFRGIMGIAQDDVFVVAPNYVFKFDTTSWGWIHMVLGALAIVVSAGLFKGVTWARYAAIGFASLLIIANFLSIPYYPLWSIVAIAMYGFIIWGLCVARSADFDKGI
ncbi:DUF7144 family membrane protein [Streptomyces sp. NPDC002004]